LFVGRLVPYKCADVVISAFARNPLLRAHKLLIVGDGPERPSLEELIKRHDLQKSVEIVGWKTQTEVGELLREADVFVFPSIRELGAGVVVEAMASGLPCIVVDYGGPGGLIHEGIGVRVPLQAKESMIDSFAAAMAQLASDPQKARDLGVAASAFAFEEYSWSNKAQKIRRIYEWVLKKRSERPKFIETESADQDQVAKRI
jgi:glycosyltransferase involved in cell wall biosynthesis